MRDFIELLQKLLPWIVGLPLIHKIIISFIIVLFAILILLLIWSPSTQEVSENNTNNSSPTKEQNHIEPDVGKSEGLPANQMNSDLKTNNVALSKQQNNIEQNLENGKNLSTNQTEISPKEIIEEINNAPPYQRDQKEENYNGLVVKWIGHFFHIHKVGSYLKEEDEIEGEIVDITVVQEKGELYRFDFKVSLEEYPQFKIAKQYDKIAVTGKIIKSRGSAYLVELDVDEIDFL